MPHPYQNLSLFTTGVVLALWLIGIHAFMLVKPAASQQFLKKLPRDPLIGQILLAIAFAWFWLLVAPSGMGKLSALEMELGEYNWLKKHLRIFLPILLVLVTMSIREFLAVRALGMLGLMVAAPLLGSAFLKDPQSRLLIPIYTYAVIFASLYWIGKPYLFRDWVNWATAKQSRWTALSLAGLGYGVATLICAFAFWRGY